MSRQLLLTVVGALLLGPPLHGADKPAKPSKPTAERIKHVRQMYEKVPCDILEIAEPVTLAGVGYSLDPDGNGKPVSVTLKDANGKKLEISLDRWPGTESLTVYDGEGNTEGSLPHRGPEESGVYGLLLRLPKETREGPGVADILEVLDKRFAGAMPRGASK